MNPPLHPRADALHVIDNLAVGILILDADERVTYANDRVGEVLGCDQRRLGGRAFDELARLESVAAIAPPHDAEGTSAAFATHSLSLEGTSERSVTAVVLRTRGADGPTSGFMVLLRPESDEDREARELGTQLGRLAALAATARDLFLGSAPREVSANDHRLARPDLLGKLSPRERDVLARLMAGSTTKQIASELGISIHTARNHMKSILRKLEARSQIDLFRKLL